MLKSTPGGDAAHGKTAKAAMVAGSFQSFRRGIRGVGAVLAFHGRHQVVKQFIMILVSQLKGKAVIAAVSWRGVVVGRADNDHRLHFALSNGVVNDIPHITGLPVGAHLGGLVGPAAVHEIHDVVLHIFGVAVRQIDPGCLAELPRFALVGEGLPGVVVQPRHGTGRIAWQKIRGRNLFKFGWQVPAVGDENFFCQRREYQAKHQQKTKRGYNTQSV